MPFFLWQSFFTLEASLPGSVRLVEVIVFDIQAIEELAVQSLTFYPYDASGADNFVVSLYKKTTAGGYGGDKYSSGSWTPVVSSQSYSVPCENTDF